ncbi:P-II family nitrogen regulator [Acetobacterium paludosum]|nr:P-II family nitrogen regulator [Acetobacterium paludosum]
MMKEIIAIIRPKKVGATKNALDKLGYPAMTAIPVLGRGKQRGLIGEINIEIRPGILEQPRVMKYIPKRQFSIIINDADVDQVLSAIIDINQTSQFGDGKIFVCPVDNIVRVRTDEEGEAAIN